MKKAEQLMKRMKQAGLEPNVVTYGTLMLGYTSVHDTTALLRTFEELKKASGRLVSRRSSMMLSLGLR
jgi:hypothetical protein